MEILGLTNTTQVMEVVYNFVDSTNSNLTFQAKVNLNIKMQMSNNSQNVAAKQIFEGNSTSIKDSGNDTTLMKNLLL